MNPRRILSFFKRLDQTLNSAAEVIVVGASAGALMGHIRPSFDIDFEIRLKGAGAIAARNKLEKAIDTAAQASGVAVNYSENVGGWSMISYLDYRRTAIFYQDVGKIKVKLIEPAYWTIGKMTRFLELDIQDMLKIIRRKKVPAGRLIKIWATAANASDFSLELGQFRDHVVCFLKHYARRLWGQSADPEKQIRFFLKTTQSRSRESQRKSRKAK